MSVLTSPVPDCRRGALRVQREGVVSRRAQTCLRYDRDVAPLGQRRIAEAVTRPQCAVKHLIRWTTSPLMLRFLSVSNLAVIDRLELEFEPGLNVLTGETGAGQVHPRRRRRPAGRRTRVAPISSAPARTPRRSRPSSRRRRRRDDRPARSLRAGAQPRIRRRRARHERGAARALRGRWSICTASTSTRCCSIPATHLDLLDAFAGARRRARSDVAAAIRAWQRRATERDALLSQRAAEGVARRVRCVPARRNRSRRAAAGRGRGAVGDATRCSPTPTVSSACARDAYDTLYTRGTPRRSRRSAASGRKSASWRRSIRGSRRTSRRASAVKSQLEDLAFFLRSYAGDIDASPARLQEVEDRLALLERLKKKHGPALADVLGTGRRRSAANCTTSNMRPSACAGNRRARWPARAPLICDCGKRSRDGAARRGGRVLRGARAGARRARDGPDAVRGPVRRRRQGSRSGRERGIDEGGVLHLAEPRRGSAAAGADRVGRRAVARHAGAEDPGVDRRAGQDADLRRGRRRHRRGSRRRGRGPTPAAGGNASRSSASPTCRRSPRTARRTSASRRACQAGPDRRPTSRGSNGPRAGTRNSRA